MISRGRKLNILHCFFILPVLVLASAACNAHELWIDTMEISEAGEPLLQIDVFWGHFGSFTEPMNPDDYTLSVRMPAGDISGLSAERDGDIIRTRFSPREPGEYVLSAVRRPSVYFPQGGGPAVLSVQTAKTVYEFHGENGSVKPAGGEIEIVPGQDLRGFRGGLLNLRVLLDGAPHHGARINIYGPAGRKAETVSDIHGLFTADLSHTGDWLIKANIREEAAGEYDGVEYGIKSLTATFFAEVPDENGGRYPDSEHHVHHEHEGGGRPHGVHARHHRRGPPVSRDALAALVAGLLLGGAGAMMFLGKKRRDARGE